MVDGLRVEEKTLDRARPRLGGRLTEHVRWPFGQAAPPQGGRRLPWTSYVGAKYQALTVAYLVAVLVIWTVVRSPYTENIATNLGLIYLLLVALQIPVYFTNQVSLVQGGVYGIAAYLAAGVQNHGGSAFLGLLAATVGAASVGLILALPLSRLRQHFFAMGTLALQVILQELFVQLTSVTGGANGEAVRGVVLHGQLLVLVVSGFCFVATICTLLLADSRQGRAMLATKTDEIMATTSGVRIAAPKVIAVVISFAFVGTAGWLFAQFAGYVAQPDFDLNESVIILGVLVLGGMGYAMGPAVGAAIYIALTTWLQGLPGYAPLILGGMIVLLLLYARGGVAGVFAQSHRWLGAAMRRQRRGSSHSSMTEAASSVAPPAVRQHAEGDATRSPRAFETSHELRSGVAEARLAVADRPYALRADGIEKSFGGNKVLRGAHVSVRSGADIVAVVGQNGAGKSTLFNVLTGIETADGGTVSLFDQDVTSMPAVDRARAGLGRTFQSPRLALDRTCLENTWYGAHWLERHGSGGARTLSGRACAMEALDAVGLASVAQGLAGSLPYGKRKLLEVARCLAGRPRVILLDEPAAGLSDDEEDELGSVLEDVSTQLDVSLMLVDHRLRLVFRLAREVVVLNAGSVMCVGTPAEIQENDEVLAEYFGEGR